MKEDYIIPLKPELSANEKKKLVEDGLKEFNVNPKFRELFIFILEESDKIYQKKMEELLKELEKEKLTGAEIVARCAINPEALIAPHTDEQWVPLEKIKEKIH